MNRIVPLGLAAALLSGTAGTVFADSHVDADPEITGAIGVVDRDIDTLVSGIETGLGTRIDLTAFGPDSTITCVTVTEMEGADDTAALDAALSEHDDPLAVLRGQIQAHQEFMTELQAACDLPQFQSEDIVSARNIGADDFVIYVDDRADPLVTGAIGATADVATYGGLVESLRAGIGLTPDRTAMGAEATIRCITVSELQDIDDGATALDLAISERGRELEMLRADVAAQQEFLNQLRASCPQVADVSADNVLSILTGAGGDFIVYIDDRT